MNTNSSDCYFLEKEDQEKRELASTGNPFPGITGKMFFLFCFVFFSFLYFILFLNFTILY